MLSTAPLSFTSVISGESDSIGTKMMNPTGLALGDYSDETGTRAIVIDKLGAIVIDKFGAIVIDKFGAKCLAPTNIFTNMTTGTPICLFFSVFIIIFTLDMLNEQYLKILLGLQY